MLYVTLMQLSGERCLVRTCEVHVLHAALEVLRGFFFCRVLDRADADARTVIALVNF